MNATNETTPVRGLEGVTVVIPALNEADSVAEVVSKTLAVLSRCAAEYEVVLVDDGSTDATAELAQQAGARVVSHPYNRGYGNSLRTGILAARFEHVIICDADQSYPLERIPDLMREAPRYDMVVGARQGSNFHGSFFKTMGRRLQLGLVRFTVGTAVPDANSGFRLFKRSLAIRYFDFVCSGFSFTTSITIAMLCEQRCVKFIPVEYHRRAGSSHVRYFRDTARSLQIIVQCMLRYNPLKAFLGLSLAALVPAAIFLILSIFNSVHLIGASVFGATSVLTLGMGMLAYAAGRQYSQTEAIDAGVYSWIDNREVESARSRRAA